MSPLRLGAVGYLNARPLVYGLDQTDDRFSVRFDVPSKCASLLHGNSIDVGLIPSIEYLQRPDYHIVPDISVASYGPVASVALFTSRPPAAIRTIAVDNSSRTSAILLRILCAQSFDIEPKFITAPPDLPAMLKRCDAAMLIGDNALFADYVPLGADKIDLGEEWTALTDLPFVYAIWVGRPALVTTDDIGRLKAARDGGVARLDEIASAYFANDPEKAAGGAVYLRNHVKFDLGDKEQAGLRKFLDVAKALGIIPQGRALKFYP